MQLQQISKQMIVFRIKAETEVLQTFLECKYGHGSRDNDQIYA